MFARSIIKELIFGKKAVVVALSGDLGAGKTTFAQGFAKGLGVKEMIKSPTFVILKRYKIPTSYKLQATSCLKYFYHLDCYRLKSAQDARSIGLPEILKNPENLVLIEWPERIEKALKGKFITVSFSSEDGTTRKISFN